MSNLVKHLPAIYIFLSRRTYFSGTFLFLRVAFGSVLRQELVISYHVKFVWYFPPALIFSCHRSISRILQMKAKCLGARTLSVNFILWELFFKKVMFAGYFASMNCYLELSWCKKFLFCYFYSTVKYIMEISNPSCLRNSSLSDDRCQGVKLKSKAALT